MANSAKYELKGSRWRLLDIFEETMGRFEDLDRIFQLTEKVFEKIRKEALEQSEGSLKILTGWGQRYDIEQLMEHAIVHVLRNQRLIPKIQIEGFEEKALDNGSP